MRLRLLPITWMPVAAALFVGLVLYLLQEPVEEPVSEVVARTPIVTHFIDETRAKVIAEVGQPIEGFEPQMYLAAYPGLTEADFRGVHASQGYYDYNGEELVFIEDRQEEPLHSAARAITDEGMIMLLAQVSDRLNVTVETEEDVSALLTTLNTATAGEEKLPYVQGIAEGVITVIDTQQAMVDGPYVITLETDAQATVDIRVPSMGLRWCTAAENISDIYQLSEGDRVSVRGVQNENGAIIPCEESSHYLRVISE